ncbi:glycosyltransferase family 2 protein [Candidatus Peregrinibacteria bacterium]|nr:glycosyltransferase family 2 protein [Candidatus Peregrinibacteria bacterium]
MKLSVIIPTHNRADTLKTCLEKLMAQKGVNFEVIVVDDGSTDHTRAAMSDVRCPMSDCTDIRYIKQSASHQGVARNKGVQAATGDVVVFIGDDIFVGPDFLQKHYDRHAEYPDENVAVLGYTTWDPGLNVNGYMKFLESSGWQFGYQFLNPGMIGKAEPYKFFYTSNISLKKSFLEKEKFNEDFKCYGWEDIELGYRLWKRHGMEIYYEPEAKAYHHHEIQPSDLPKKMRAVGRSAVHFQRLQPEVRVIPQGLRRRALKLATNNATLPLIRILGDQMYYKFRSWNEFLKGVENKG